MADTPTYLSIILNDGKFAIGQGLVQAKKLKPYKFVVGDAYNFTPNDDGTTVQGNVVYTGSSSLIKGSIVSKDQFKFTLIIPESAGPFTVGNIILYVQSDDGIVFPFIWVSLKIPYPKIGQQVNTVGNRFVFDFIEKIVNVTDVLDIDITPSEYFSLAGYSDEFTLPAPEQALFQQFYVHEPAFSPVPIIGARRGIDNTYWGLPLYSKIGDPFFGVISGGQAGEKSTNSKFFWGGRLSMSDDDLRITYGGGTLSDTPVYSIGGEPLVDNPGYDLDSSSS